MSRHQIENNLKDKLGVIYVPDWILQIAVRNKITLFDLLKYDNFSRYLSLNDQILFLTTQYYMNNILLSIKYKGEVYHREIDNLYDISGLPADMYQKNPGLLESIEKLYMNDKYINTIHARLFSISAYAGVNGESLTPQVVNVVDNVVALILKPGQIVLPEGEMNGNSIQSEAVIDFLIRAMEECLKQFYVYSPQSVVNSTDWFEIYTNLLAKQAAIPY